MIDIDTVKRAAIQLREDNQTDAIYPNTPSMKYAEGHRKGMACCAQLIIELIEGDMDEKEFYDEE